jgi:hypothetical protein
VVLRGKLNGAKSGTEAMDYNRKVGMVGERSVSSEGRPEGRLERTEVRMQA